MSFGSFFKKIAPIASLVAAPFTGGASLLGTLGNAASIFGALSTAQGLFGGNKGPAPIQAAQAPPFKPVRPDAAAMPASLAGDFASFSPDQQRSALATKGLNQGLGGEEDAYYRNLVQRSLIGDGNQVQPGSPDQYLLPIESQYFSHKGLNTSDTTKFLQGLSG